MIRNTLLIKNIKYLLFTYNNMSTAKTIKFSFKQRDGTLKQV
jgi:hypothetical protein